MTSIQEVNDALVETKTTKANLDKSNEEFNIECEKHALSERQFNIGDSSKLDEMRSEVNLYITKQRNFIFVSNGKTIGYTSYRFS